MKKAKFLLPLILPFMCLGVTGCGGLKVEKNAINVKLLLGGYGSEWLEKAIEKFEAAYAKEGYKIKLQTPNRMVDGNDFELRRCGISQHNATSVWCGSNLLFHILSSW